MKKTKHHRLPSSRQGGGGKNIAIIDGYRHQLWHQIVGNATAEEACELFKVMFREYDIKFILKKRSSHGTHND